MEQCAICGQPAERGKTCGHCRAAIKRARDETVSQFQPAPALAVAGPAEDPGGVRAKPHRPRLSVATAGSAARPIVLRAEVVSGRSGASPFVWLIVVLMVLVVIFVAAGVINAAIESARASRGATAEPAPAVPLATAAVPAPSLPAVAAARKAIAPLPREVSPGVEVEASVRAVWAPACRPWTSGADRRPPSVRRPRHPLRRKRAHPPPRLRSRRRLPCQPASRPLRRRRSLPPWR